MAKKRDASGEAVPGFLAYLGRSVEAHTVQAGRLDELRQALLTAGEENLRLHRETLGTVDAMRRDIERMKRTLRALARARA